MELLVTKDFRVGRSGILPATWCQICVGSHLEGPPTSGGIRRSGILPRPMVGAIRVAMYLVGAASCRDKTSEAPVASRLYWCRVFLVSTFTQLEALAEIAWTSIAMARGRGKPRRHASTTLRLRTGSGKRRMVISRSEYLSAPAAVHGNTLTPMPDATI